MNQIILIYSKPKKMKKKYQIYGTVKKQLLSILFISLLIFSTPFASISDTEADKEEKSEGIEQSISIQELKDHIYFLAFTAEEKGLYGSEYFLNNSPVSVENIVANINFDCIGRKGNYVSEGIEIFAQDADKSDIHEILENINNSQQNISIQYQLPTRLGNADHENFLEKNIPAFTFFDGGHPDLHQPGDDPEKIDYFLVRKVTLLGYKLLMKIANQAERVHIN